MRRVRLSSKHRVGSCLYSECSGFFKINFVRREFLKIYTPPPKHYMKMLLILVKECFGTLSPWKLNPQGECLTCLSLIPGLLEK